MAASKNYWHLVFPRCVLGDKFNKLFNAQEGKTKAMRQWRFSTLEDIEQNAEFIQMYIDEAIENQKQGKELKISRATKIPETPVELEDGFTNNPPLKKSFDSLCPRKQREWLPYKAD